MQTYRYTNCLIMAHLTNSVERRERYARMERVCLCMRAFWRFFWNVSAKNDIQQQQVCFFHTWKRNFIFLYCFYFSVFYGPILVSANVPASEADQAHMLLVEFFGVLCASHLRNASVWLLSNNALMDVRACLCTTIMCAAVRCTVCLLHLRAWLRAFYGLRAASASGKKDIKIVLDSKDYGMQGL